jgi:protein-S-isoprenylcysteine O-methyltransferase
VTPVVYGNAVAAGSFWGVVLAWEIVEWRQQAREARSEADVDRDRGSARLIRLATWTAIPAGFGLAHVDVARIPGGRWPVYAIGCGLLVSGIALRQWSIRTLGCHFRRRVTIQAGHRLVRRGPYRLLRHPAYAGSLAAVAGMGVAFGSWPALAACLVPITAAVVHRIRVEESALEEWLGEPYRDYERSTSRLVPGIW